MGDRQFPESLHSAEKAARNGSLSVKIHATCREDSSLSELVSFGESLDKYSLQIYQGQKLRKLLLRYFPRLGQVLEEIAKSGSIEEYLKRNFGEVYLWRGHAQLFDLNLSRSGAKEERQKKFLNTWNAPDIFEFGFSDLAKASHKTDLPEPEALRRLVDEQLLADALEKRSVRNNFLDKVAGRYVVNATTDSAALKEKIGLLLEMFNSPISPDEIIADSRKITKVLMRLGVHPRNPILSFFGRSEEHVIDLVISNESLDILQASTEKPWDSCVNLEGGDYRKGLYEDIANSAVIAYVMQGDKFVSRMIIRAGLTLRRKKPAAAIEKLYGNQRYRILMQKAIRQILKQAHIAVDTSMETHIYSNDTCLDSASGKAVLGGRYYYTEKGYRPSHWERFREFCRRLWKFLNQDARQCFAN
ncbi:MAG: hypothetical protein HZB99_00645 [Candidatus Harrisonbacteria bacterium]|nr:hypothetical protein [Candidatus Harrisonbacteria bacterium]